MAKEWREEDLCTYVQRQLLKTDKSDRRQIYIHEGIRTDIHIYRENNL